MALGKQYVDIWKNSNELGKAAGQAALALCSSPDFSKIAGQPDRPVGRADGRQLPRPDFTTPGGNTVKSIILQPTPITADKLGWSSTAGWITKDELCKGVDGRDPGAGRLQVTVSDR